MRFLFCSLASPGFLFPHIGLALELRQRGHEVAFVTDASYADHLKNAGLDRIPRGSTDGRSFQIAGWTDVASVAIQVKHIEFAAASFSPDILVGHQMTYGPLISRDRTGIPVALLGFCTWQWEDANPEIPLDAFSGLTKLRVSRQRGWYSFYRRLRSSFRLEVAAENDYGFVGDLFMLRSIPKWEPRLSHLPPQVHCVGPCLWEPRSDAPDVSEWLVNVHRTGKPIVYAQHGPSYDQPSFWQPLTQAMMSVDIHLACSAGRSDHDFSCLPEDSLVREHISQGHVLEHCSAVISTANTTVTLGAIRAGLPSLLIPHGGEQPDVAAYCRDSGIAKVIEPEDLEPNLMARELEDVLYNLDLRENALRWSEAFADYEGFDISADLLERLASTGRPVLRTDIKTRAQ